MPMKMIWVTVTFQIVVRQGTQVHALGALFLGGWGAVDSGRHAGCVKIDNTDRIASVVVLTRHTETIVYDTTDSG